LLTNLLIFMQWKKSSMCLILINSVSC
jgi:hypothetical protein